MRCNHGPLQKNKNNKYYVCLHCTHNPVFVDSIIHTLIADSFDKTVLGLNFLQNHIKSQTLSSLPNGTSFDLYSHENI